LLRGMYLVRRKKRTVARIPMGNPTVDKVLACHKAYFPESI
jgi:hypothetical protein